MSILLGAVALPDGLFWGNQFSWTPIALNEKTGATGALLRQTGFLQYRPIHLKSRENFGQVDEATMNALFALLLTDADMPLVFPDGRGSFASTRWSTSNPLTGTLAGVLAQAPWATATALYAVEIRLVTPL
jgi:hypothetical protein